MDFSGKKVLIMGLGLHGGGLESARFALKRGAEVTVTDLREEAVLKTSMEELEKINSELNKTKGARAFGSPAPVRYVIGKHEIDDFKNADIVIKNPGVRPDSPFLKAAKIVETDISLFLQENPARLFAVTGTKGKSGTAAALYHILSNSGHGCLQVNSQTSTAARRVYLGGNITVSPLTFLDELAPNDDVVLELSSFQLGDLKGRVKEDGSPLLKPAAAILTAIMPDHLDRYASMEEYVDDKRVIFRGQDSSCVTVACDDEWGRSFLYETKAKPVFCSFFNKPRNTQSFTEENKELLSTFPRTSKLSEGQQSSSVNLLPEKLLVPGEHQKINLLAAALAVYYTEGENDETAEAIRSALSTFKGIEHRLEFFFEKDGVRFFNDSAATIPEAAAACIEALSENAPLVLVTGGTDKNLDFTPLVKAAPKAAALILLAGTGSEKLARLLAEKGIAFSGPFDDLEAAVTCAIAKAENLHCSLLTANCSLINVALSPGCASFGMFKNEFDRGRRWKEAVIVLANNTPSS